MKIGQYEYVRCSQSLPCPLCGRTKYCCVSADKQFVLCTKVAWGAIRSYSYGNLHILDPEMKPKQLPKETTHTPSSEKVFYQYSRCLFKWKDIKELADKWGYNPRYLSDAGCGWHPEKKCWVFPMYNLNRHLCGLKARNRAGRKWTLAHSRLGLLIPRSYKPVCPVLICEGESDMTALLSQGYNVLGRPAARACHKLLVDFVKNPECFVFADCDNGDGIVSSVKLAERLPNATVIYNPNFKDVREWVDSGKFSTEEFMKFRR